MPKRVGRVSLSVILEAEMHKQPIPPLKQEPTTNTNEVLELEEEIEVVEMILNCKNRQKKENITPYLKPGQYPAEYSKEEMRAYIKEYVKECEACSRFDSLKTIQPIYINHITKKYDLFMMDCLDLRRYSDQNDQYSWILNVIDTYTKHL
ncbi:hypothetical protein CWI36_1918p0010 [Hamiltosporidium magnivora]|uniref:Integrase zinc-binding domain-containing protein n=1 Tax=Hamiltosporidium magnivora TaxID=148818 RepID=A0A4Q9KXC6_9MICR|nr:hypothetical protein CWI36_1918p0010 [Hamiltosporidium magnivora]